MRAGLGTSWAGGLAGTLSMLRIQVRGRYTMKTTELIRRSLLCMFAVACCLGGVWTATTVAARGANQGSSQDEEVQMGQEVFNELKAKGEIVESSPLYDQLRP